MERVFALIYLTHWIVLHGWLLLPQNFALGRSLPIHICDLTALLVPVTLLCHQRIWAALLYFWGIGFSLQGLITPDLALGLYHPLFWLFWLHHASIVGTAVYMIVVHRFRPTRRDYWWAVRGGFIYLIFVFPLNIRFGFNYGYLGNAEPSQPSLIDWLGAWPWRVGSMAILAWLGMTLLLLPWEWTRSRKLSQHW
jgi:hypothetical integral membrane protein (TIGR02206 family)